MPYIDAERRKDFEDAINNFPLPNNVGELNYCLTSLILEYMNWTPNSKNYEAWNSVIGVLECAKLEMYRRAVAPYEDNKIKQNGDVY